MRLELRNFQKLSRSNESYVITEFHGFEKQINHLYEDSSAKKNDTFVKVAEKPRFMTPSIPFERF